MNRTEFIKLIIKKRLIDKEIFQKSLKIDDFPIAREILKKIDGNENFKLLLNSKNFSEIQTAKANLISNVVYKIKDRLLQSETQKLLNDLVNLKIIGDSKITSLDSKSNKKRDITKSKIYKNLPIKNISEVNIQKTGLNDKTFQKNNFKKPFRKLFFFFQKNKIEINLEKNFGKLSFYLVISLIIIFATILLSRRSSVSCSKTSGDTICINKKTNIICRSTVYWGGHIHTECGSL